jgi:hypothetical protein
MVRGTEEIWLKIKGFRETLKGKEKEFFTAALIVLVAIGAFGLGRLSALENKGGEVKILSASVSNSSDNRFGGEEGIEVIETPTLEAGGKVVASKTGTKYHLPWCQGAKAIKIDNIIWFNSAQEAREAGYMPASNCKGIE